MLFRFVDVSVNIAKFPSQSVTTLVSNETEDGIEDSFLHTTNNINYLVISYDRLRS